MMTSRERMGRFMNTRPYKQKKFFPLNLLMSEILPSEVPVKFKNLWNITLGRRVTLRYHHTKAKKRFYKETNFTSSCCIYTTMCMVSDLKAPFKKSRGL